jgi:hypothetical protein
MKARNRLWFLTHKPKARESARKYYHRLGHERHRDRKYGKGAGAYWTRHNLLQRGLCLICKCKDSRALCLDHDHKTKKLRGLLCGRCNFFVGFLEGGRWAGRYLAYLKKYE